MKSSASAELIDYLNSSQQFCIADLYTFTLNNGTVLRLNSSDMELTVGGNTFSLGPLLRRSNLTTAVGLEVATLDIEITAVASHLIGGIPWLVAARTGLLDSASVRLERLFMPTWGDVSLGAIIEFDGQSGPAEIDNQTVHITAKSDLELLNVATPRNIYQAGCLHTLFDAGCGLSRASFEVATTATSGATKTSIPIAASNAAGYFDLGTIEFTSGACAGQRRAIKRHTLNLVTITLPLPAIPANGDTCIVTPGCDKLQATCETKFSNRNRFRGYAYIPVSETAA